MLKNSNIFIFLPIISLFIFGCGEHWQIIQPITQPQEEIWEICQSVIQICGYKENSQQSIDSKTEQSLNLQKTLYHWKSQWLYHLQPLRSTGSRSCLHITLEPYLQEKNTWQIRLKVVKQKNHATDDYMNPNLAIWLADGYDLQQEIFLSNLIQTKLYLQKNDNKER